MFARVAETRLEIRAVLAKIEKLLTKKKETK
mgnify:CR=1 FL=1